MMEVLLSSAVVAEFEKLMFDPVEYKSILTHWYEGHIK